MTGENLSLGARLLMVAWGRTGDRVLSRQSFIDAGYCIDAPSIIPAGSHERDVFGTEDDDWVAVPTFIDRIHEVKPRPTRNYLNSQRRRRV
jgi:hypothetical protein